MIVIPVTVNVNLHVFRGGGICKLVVGYRQFMEIGLGYRYTKPTP